MNRKQLLTYGVRCCIYLSYYHLYSRNDKAAHELIHGLKPEVSIFAPFYVSGITYASADDKHWANTNKGEPILFLGYSGHCKDSYVILHVKTRAISLTKNYLFDENLLYHNMKDFDQLL